MLVKPFVLDRDKRVLKVFRDLVDGHIGAVGAGGGQRFDLVAVLVKDRRGKAGRRDVHVGDVRTVVDEFDRIQTAADQGDGKKGYHKDQGDLQELHGKAFAAFGVLAG